MRSSSLVWLVLLSAVLFYGVWRLFDLRFAQGNIYPPYSSLRADQQGTRALFDSIAALPGFQVSRSYRPFDKLPPGKRTIFVLGVSARDFEYGADEEYEQFETLAANGARIVIGFRAAQPEARSPRATKVRVESPLRRRWQLEFSYLNRIDSSDHTATALFFTSASPVWQGTGSLLERKFGAGSILLVAQSYPLSNEGLQLDRQSGLLASLIGANRQVVFDEGHLGVMESGSVAGLARKYRLEGVVAALLVLAALFLWKNSVSFLPPRAAAEAADRALTSAKDASSGMANLLRRNIPESDLIRTCVAQWEHDQAARVPPAQVARVRVLAGSASDPAQACREIHRVLTGERSNG